MNSGNVPNAEPQSERLPLRSRLSDPELITSPVTPARSEFSFRSDNRDAHSDQEPDSRRGANVKLVPTDVRGVAVGRVIHGWSRAFGLVRSADVLSPAIRSVF